MDYIYTMMFRVLVILLLVSLRAGATVQIPDLLYFNGKTYSNNRYFFLLEQYFDEHPDRKPQPGVISTALHRGYIATFEFRDWQMLLKDVMVDSMIESPSLMDFAGINKIDYVLGPLKKLKIEWFSGLVVLPTGTVFKNIECEYSDCQWYTEYTLFRVVNGDVILQRALTCKQYKQCVDKHYEAYQQTPEYKMEYDYYLASAYFQSTDFLERFELWTETPDGKKNTISDPDPVRENYLRQIRFKQTNEYKIGYALWTKQPQAIFNAETKTRVSFEFSTLEQVIQDTSVISYYIE